MNSPGLSESLLLLFDERLFLLVFGVLVLLLLEPDGTCNTFK